MHLNTFSKVLLLFSFVFSVAPVACVYARDPFFIFIKSGNIAQYDIAVDGFKKELSREGVRYQAADYAPGDSVEDAVNGKNKPDLIVTIGSKATETALASVHDIPILYFMVINPPANKKNSTGVLLTIPPAANFKILKKLLPQSHRIGIIYNPRKSANIVKEAQEQAQEDGLSIVTKEVHSLADVYGAVRSLTGSIDALYMIPDPTVYTKDSTEDILLYTLQRKVPVIGISPAYVTGGALFSLSCRYEDIGRQAGTIAVKIVRGETPAGISVVSPETNDLSINLVTAERMGIHVPDAMIKESKNVFQ